MARPARCGGAPRPAAPPDPRVADLERAEPDPLLVGTAVRAPLRHPAARRPRRRARRRPGRDRRPRRACRTRSWSRAARDLRGRRRREASTPSRCTRTRAARATSCAPSSTAATWDARARRPEGPDLGHRALVAGGEGKVDNPGRLRGQRPRPGGEAQGWRCGGSKAARGAARDRARVLVHVGSPAETGPERVRLVGPAPGARAGGSVAAPALAAFQRLARRFEGCAKAPGDALRCR